MIAQDWAAQSAGITVMIPCLSLDEIRASLEYLKRHYDLMVETTIYVNGRGREVLPQDGGTPIRVLKVRDDAPEPVITMYRLLSACEAKFIADRVDQPRLFDLEAPTVSDQPTLF